MTGVLSLKEPRRFMSNKRKIKGSNVKLLMARATEVRPGSVNIATISHDDWCSIHLERSSMIDCDCHPEITINEVGENATPT